MTHKFINEYLKFDPDVFEGVNSLSNFKGKIARHMGKSYYAGFSGFAWEYVVAEYIKRFGEHPTVDVCDYVQTYAGTHGDLADHGVDGYGFDGSGEYKIICQVKYRSEIGKSFGKDLFDPNGEEDLTTFINEICRVRSEQNKIMVLFCTTTDEGIGKTGITQNEMFGDNILLMKHLRVELKKRGVPDIYSIPIKIFNYWYWEKSLNPRFWAHLRMLTNAHKENMGIG